MDKDKLIKALESKKQTYPPNAYCDYHNDGLNVAIKIIKNWQDEPTCVLCAYRKALKDFLASIIDLPKTGAEFFDESIEEIFATCEQTASYFSHWKGDGCNDEDEFLKDEDGYFVE